MKDNIPIPDLLHGEDVWLALVVASVRERRSQQGELFHLASARNASGALVIRFPGQAGGEINPIKPGLWGIIGRLDTFQNQSQFVASEYRPITVEKYMELQAAEPPFPKAFTIDIETIPLPAFRDRVPIKLKRAFQSGRMGPEQQERYLEDSVSEEDRAYRLGSLAAISGRVLSIAVHVGGVAGLPLQDGAPPDCEYVFGIDSDGRERTEEQALNGFVSLLTGFDPQIDEIVGHNIIGFDLPFILQRCLINSVPASLDISLSEYNPRGVFDTMLRWWFGGRNRVSLDDLGWALGFESSKTDEVDGSRIFDLYHSGNLSQIREYNLNDVRLTRKIYERIVSAWGR